MIQDRFKDAPWYKQFPIIVGGAGGIGSWLSLFLARIGHQLFIYDFDNIEESNIGGQFYEKKSIGQMKTNQLIMQIEKFAGNEKCYKFERYDEDAMVENIMFSGFDKMAPRKVMVEKWYNHQISKSRRPKDEVNIFIDGRMEAETGIIYAIKSKRDYQRYMDEFFDDSQVADKPCTFAATTHMAAILAGNMVNVFNNHVANKIAGYDIRSVPFKVDIQLPTITSNVEM